MSFKSSQWATKSSFKIQNPAGSSKTFCLFKKKKKTLLSFSFHWMSLLSRPFSFSLSHPWVLPSNYSTSHFLRLFDQGLFSAKIRCRWLPSCHRSNNPFPSANVGQFATLVQSEISLFKELTRHFFADFHGSQTMKPNAVVLNLGTLF